MNSLAVYMFHSIGQLDSDDCADPHYNYSTDAFTDLLFRLGTVNSLKNAINNNDFSKNIVTFDDGHLSNYKTAVEMIHKQSGFADFFINPAMVGKKSRSHCRSAT